MFNLKNMLNDPLAKRVASKPQPAQTKVTKKKKSQDIDLKSQCLDRHRAALNRDL